MESHIGRGGGGKRYVMDLILRWGGEGTMTRRGGLNEHEDFYLQVKHGDLNKAQREFKIIMKPLPITILSHPGVFLILLKTN